MVATEVRLYTIEYLFGDKASLPSRRIKGRGWGRRERILEKTEWGKEGEKVSFLDSSSATPSPLYACYAR